MNKSYYSKLLLGAVSGASLLIASQSVKAETINKEINCEYPVYKQYPLVQESDCTPNEEITTTGGQYTS